MLSIAIQVLLIGAIFYWLLIKPQRDERKRHQAMVAALKKGDEVATVGGIIGTIVHVEEDRVTLKTGENTRLVVERQKISRTAAPGTST
ncbi:MAG: preprotein translocase subunit YajC [Gemmatimonadota bacterium]